MRFRQKQPKLLTILLVLLMLPVLPLLPCNETALAQKYEAPFPYSLSYSRMNSYSIDPVLSEPVILGLSSIELSSWALMFPSFDTDTTLYRIVIPYAKDHIEIIPKQIENNARVSVTVDGRRQSSVITLEKDQSKTVLITVTPKKGSGKRVYTLSVARPYPPRQYLGFFKNLMPASFMDFEQLINDDKTRDLPPDPSTLPPSDTYMLEVDLVNQYVTAYTKDADGEYTIPTRFMICSSGHKKTPTPVGTFKMGTIKRRFGYFQDYGVYAQYWTQVVGGIFFHSVIYEKRDERTLTESSYENLGTAVSHGCIRLLPPDAKWIYEHCAPGTVVVITKSKVPDPFLPSLLLPPPMP